MPRALVLVLICAGVAAAGPPRAVHGVVTASDSGQPIAGATVRADDGAAATTGLDGSYTLAVGPAAHAVTFTAAGYVARTLAIDGAVLDAALAPAPGEVIEITGRAPEQTRAPSYRMTADEVRLVPGAGNDILRAVQVLPGVARIPYSFGGLVLRGAAPSDSAVYLDGIEVPYAFHFGGITSFYPASMLGELTVTAGGFDAAYGRAEGGIVTLTTREPRTDRWRIGGSIGLLDSGVTAEGPLGGGGILLGARWSYLGTVFEPFVGDDIPLPSYWDAQARASFGDPERHGRITPLVFLSIDRIANRSSGQLGAPEHVAIESVFVRAAIAYLRQWGPLALHVVPWLGTDRLSFEDVDHGDRETFERPVYPAGLRADLARDFTWGHLSAGLDGAGGYLSHSQAGFTGTGFGAAQTSGHSTLAWADVGLWSEARLALFGDRLGLRPGLRAEHYGLTGEWVIDPRLQLDEQLAPGLVLRAAAGRYHQPPAPADVDPIDGNVALHSSYFDQASLGLDAQPSEATLASLTGYVEYGWDLGVRVPDPRHPDEELEPNLGGLGPTFDLLLQRQLGFSTYRANQGRARSLGLEVLIEHHAGRWFGLVSYTLAKADRKDAPAFDWRRFELDERHDLNVAGSVALGAWRLGARIQVVTGAPYSPTTCAMMSNTFTCTQKPWAGTLPTFFQLDLRADHVWHRSWGDANLYLDIENATNYANVEGREFSSDLEADRDIAGLPIVPFVGVEFIPR